MYNSVHIISFRCVPEFVLVGALRHKQDNIKCEYQGNAQKKTPEGEVRKGAGKTRRRERKSGKKQKRTLTQTQAPNSMKQGPSRKAASSLPSREFLRNLPKPKVHYRVHNSPPVVPVDSQMNPIHSRPSCFIQTHFNIIVLSNSLLAPPTPHRTPLSFGHFNKGKGKGKAAPLQAWSGPQGSRKLRFPDFMTTAQDGGKVVSLTH